MRGNNNSYSYFTVDNADDINEGGLHTVQDAPLHDMRDARYSEREERDLYNFYAAPSEPYVPPLTGKTKDMDPDGIGEPPFKRKRGDGFEYVPEGEAFADIDGDGEDAVDGTHLGVTEFDEEDYQADRDIEGYVDILKERDESIDAIVDKGFGVFTALWGNMGSAEITVKTLVGVNTFESLRPHLPALARTLALSMNYTETDLHKKYPHKKVTHYKVMVILFCTFIKINMDGSKEYRTFVFDQMAEDDKGHYYAVVSADSIYKAVYNTFLKVAYEKLDMRNMANVPNIDSKFEFYSMRTAGATLFRYNALKVNGKEDD